MGRLEEARKNLFQSPLFLWPMGAVAVVSSLFLMYYFVIISRNESSLNNRAFRTLGAVSQQFQDVVSNYQWVLRLVLGQAKATARTKSAQAKNDPLTFKTHQVPHLQVNFAKTCIKIKTEPLDIVSTPGRLRFGDDTCHADIALDLDFAPLLTGTPDEVFDEVLLADSEGKVLFQTRKTGLVAASLASLFTTPPEGEEKPAKKPEGAQRPEATAGRMSSSSSIASHGAGSAFSAVSQASALRDVTLSGAVYKAYVVPVPFAATNLRSQTGADHAAATGQARLVLCGLVRQSRFRAESMSIPGIILAAGVLLMLLFIVAAWPLLRFQYIRPTERISRSTGQYYVLSSTTTVVLIFMLAIHVRYVFSDRETDENLKRLAQSVDAHVADEVKHALKVMDSMEASLIQETDSKRKVKDFDAGICLPTQDEPLNPTPNLLAVRGMQLADYPYFLRFYEYDSLGFERVKWVVDSDLPPAVRVCDRPYFLGTVRNNL